MSPRKTASPIAAVAAIATAVVAALTELTPGSKLERLKVREVIKSALGLPKEAIISREAGHIDIVVSGSMFTTASLQAALEAAAASNGIQIRLVGTPTSENEVVKLSFTNDLMQAQADWGARGNSRQSRVLAAMPAPAPVAPAQPAEVAATTAVAKPKGKRNKNKTAA